MTESFLESKCRELQEAKEAEVPEKKRRDDDRDE